jgi:hypothetical protein
MQFLVELFALGAACPQNWSRHFPENLPAPGLDQKSKKSEKRRGFNDTQSS